MVAEKPQSSSKNFLFFTFNFFENLIILHFLRSLKYMTTGGFPPGSDRGKNFIHDPKMHRNSVVVGTGKLQFVGIDGKPYVISRSIEARKTKVTMQMKTIDTAIFYEHNGEKKHLDSKCADINSEMMRHLGVTEPILNYVIFCHQEDSNWPMDEGGKVKAKFDEIFSGILNDKHLLKISC